MVMHLLTGHLMPVKSQLSEEKNFSKAVILKILGSSMPKTEYTIHVEETSLVDRCKMSLTLAKYPDPSIVIVKGRFVMTQFKITLLRCISGIAALKIEISSSEEAKSIEKL